MRKTWWKYVYLLGLDAPLVAVLWLFLFAQTWRVDYHPWEAYVALGLVSWTVRIVGKLLHSAIAGDGMSFQAIHSKGLSRAAFISGLLAVGLIILNFPLSVYNYLLVSSILVICYFALALFTPAPDGEIPYAKHLFAGLAFAFGVSLMAHAYLPGLGIRDLFFSREFICFAVLCLIVSSAVDLWTSRKMNEGSESNLVDELVISLPLTLLGAASLIFAVQAESMISRPFFYGILTGAALLQILNRLRSRFTMDQLKSLASACLLVPGIIFQAYDTSM